MTAAVARVLIVDDDDGIRRSLARVIRNVGYDVDTAEDGLAAVESAKSFRPDLLVIDLRMPGIDGVEAYRRIRVDDPEVAAIFMTAYSSANLVEDAFGLGAHQVLSKPIDIDRLVASIDQITQADSN